MHYIKYLLNLPWTLLGLCNVIFCVPYKVEFRKDAIVFRTLHLGLLQIYAPKGKGYSLGNMVVVRRNASEKILHHELIHVEQHMRYPFICAFLYHYELLRLGYFNNKFEVEAYDRSDTWPEKELKARVGFTIPK